MTSGMSYPELLRWAAFYYMEGWPEYRADVRSGLICSVIANVNRDPEKRPEAFSVYDFMPFQNRGGEEKVVNPDDAEDAKVSPDIVTWLFNKSGAIDVLREELREELHGD